MVRLVGLEPTRPFEHQILSLGRLPISPQPHLNGTLGQIRTDTLQILSLLPLPVGLLGQMVRLKRFELLLNGT